MYSSVYLIFLILFSLIGIWLPLPFFFRLMAVTLATCFIPGWLFVQTLDSSRKYFNFLEKIVLAFGLGFGLAILGALIVLYGTGQLTREGIIIWFIVTILILSITYGWRIHRQQTLNRLDHLTYLDVFYSLIPLLVAASFSLVNLHYADYWGDEMNGLLRAISVIEGRQGTIFEHTKGPVEILLPAIFGLLVQRFDPFTVRFPFSLAYTVGIGSFYLLVQHMFDRKVAFWASLLLAINGLHLGFGRIVQYQSIVFLTTNLSIFVAYGFYRTGKTVFLGMSAFLAGIGLLAHYDMLLVLPALGFLVGCCYGKNLSAWRNAWPQWVGAAMIVLVVTAIFYVPFFLNPQASETTSYLARRISISNLISNNFDELYESSVVNNSRYYMLWLMLFGWSCIATDLYSVREQYKNIRLWLIIIPVSGLALLAVILGQAYLVPVIVFTLLFVLLVGFSSVSVELKLVYVWVGAAFIGYVFFVEDPRSHLRIIYPGFSILAALGLFRLVSMLFKQFSFLQRRWAPVGGIVLLGLLFVLFAVYQYLLFVDTKREYIFTYPQHKSSFYWEDPDFPFRTRRLYGAPHRLGWQKINELYLQGYFSGDWDSNDESSNLFWYTLGEPRNQCYAQYYFLTQFEQKLGFVEYLPDLVAKGYVKTDEVWNRDRLQIEVFEFAPLGYDGEMNVWPEPEQYSAFVVPVIFQSDPYEENDNITVEQVGHPLSDQAVFKPHPEILKEVAEQYQDSRINNVRDKIALLGYDLDETWLQPGGALVVTLYWQAVENVNLPYKVSVRLESQAGELWSQADDFPACGTQPTYQWPVGHIITDRHVLRLPQDMPEGDYEIKVGLYEPKTNLHLDLLDSLGNPAGVSFRSGTVMLPGSSDLVE